MLLNGLAAMAMLAATASTKKAAAATITSTHSVGVGADASAIVGSHATRAQGTIGGNVMNASPAMDTGGPLLCFGATATLRSASGDRSAWR